MFPTFTTALVGLFSVHVEAPLPCDAWRHAFYPFVGYSANIPTSHLTVRADQSCLLALKNEYPSRIVSLAEVTLSLAEYPTHKTAVSSTNFLPLPGTIHRFYRLRSITAFVFRPTIIRSKVIASTLLGSTIFKSTQNYNNQNCFYTNNVYRTYAYRYLHTQEMGLQD